ncbi:hypothetical protein KEM54_002090 [Ascosphaera aggregata]|nr:hypothetical protein KEM54_002090 [Ascosphaera aggregata]
MATAHLSDHPTPPSLPPSTRFMDRAAVNSQATSSWSWPASRKTSTTSRTPPAIDTNVHFDGVELDPTFTAQRPASSAAFGGMANPSPVEDTSLLTTIDEAFQGEKPLSARSVEQSNNAYDQSLLSKLGGPESARSSVSSLCGTAGKGLSTLPFHSKSRPSLAGVSLVDTSVSPRDEASSPPFPFSSASSRHPSIVRSTLFDNVSYQNPSAANVMPPSVEVDPLTRVERRSTITKSSLIEDTAHHSTGRLPRRS